MKLTNKTVFVTGATAGIGEACAEVFAEAGANLILLGRREEKLNALSAALSEKHGIKCHNIACDITNYHDLDLLLHEIPDEFKTINILINNAGLARGLAKLHEGDLNDWEEMIDTNIKGLLYVSRFVLPQMAERKEGQVINIASIAGREVYPMGAVYCASKHAVKALSQGMAIDLNGTGVKVSNIDPGLVETEFAKVRFHGDEDKAANVYKGYAPLTGMDIAEIALFMATRPKHVMIQDLLVTPTDQASATIVHKIL